MQTCSAALNSAATLFTYDVWKRWQPNTSDHSLVKIGRWTTAIATLLAIVLSPIFGHYNTIFKGLTTLICYIAPPITAVFLVGVFWKKAGGRAAFLTMVAGLVLGSVGFFLDFCKDPIVAHFGADVADAQGTAKFVADSPVLNIIYNYAVKDMMMASFGIFCILVVFQIVATLAIAEPPKEEAKSLSWDDWRASRWRRGPRPRTGQLPHSLGRRMRCFPGAIHHIPLGSSSRRPFICHFRGIFHAPHNV